MAYAATISTRARLLANVPHTEITVVETDVSPSDAWSVPAPLFGTVVSHVVERTVPDLATTVAPTVGIVSGGSSILGGMAGSVVRDTRVAEFLAAGGLLHGRSNVNAHANEVTTTLLIARGHHVRRPQRWKPSLVGAAAADPNSTLVEPVTEPVPGMFVFKLKAGAGPHTGPHQAAIIAWPALDDNGRRVSSPYSRVRIDELVLSPPPFDSEVVVEVGFCSLLSPVSEYFGAAVYWASGGAVHRRYVSPGPTVTTSTTGESVITRAMIMAVTGGQSDRSKTVVRAVSDVVSRDNGALYTSSLAAPARNMTNNGLFYYAAVYCTRTGGLAAPATVVLQVRPGSQNPTSWDWWEPGGEKWCAVGDSIMSEVQSVQSLEYTRLNAMARLLKRGPVQAAGHLNDSGTVSARYRHSCVGGATSASMAANFATYRAQAGPADIYTLMLGANDAGASVADTTYDTNMRSVISQMRASDPGCRIYCIGPTPSINGTLDTLLAAYAAKCALMPVDGYGDARTGFSTGTMLDDDVHLNVLGHQFLASVVASTVKVASEVP